MTQQDRYAPTPRQAAALARVEKAREDKERAEERLDAKRKAWLERMFSASFEGAAHAHVAVAAGILPERYRQLRLQFHYEAYCADREAEAA